MKQVVETVGVANELQSEIQMVTSSAFHVNDQTLEQALMENLARVSSFFQTEFQHLDSNGRALFPDSWL